MKNRTVSLTSGILWKGATMRLDRNFQVTSFNGSPQPCRHANQRHHVLPDTESWRVSRALVCMLEGAIVGAVCMDCLHEAAES
jgi:hypothetical protein